MKAHVTKEKYTFWTAVEEGGDDVICGFVKGKLDNERFGKMRKQIAPDNYHILIRDVESGSTLYDEAKKMFISAMKYMPDVEIVQYNNISEHAKKIAMKDLKRFLGKE